MTRKPRTLLLVAAVGAVVFFLLGAPEISEGTGTLQDVVAWLSMVVGVLTLAALVLGVWGLVTNRRQSSSQGQPTPTPSSLRSRCPPAGHCSGVHRQRGCRGRGEVP